MKKAWCMDKRKKWRRRRNKYLVFKLFGREVFYQSDSHEYHKFYGCTPKEHYERYEPSLRDW